MRKILALIIVLCGLASAQITPTPNIGLSKIVPGSEIGAWGPIVNTNWDIIDSYLGGTFPLPPLPNLSSAKTNQSVFNVGGDITQWAGVDLHAKMMTIYNGQMNSTGGEIDVYPTASGACWNSTTTATFNTPGKLPYIIFKGGACDNYTPVSSGNNAYFLDYATTNTFSSNHGFQNLVLINNGCTTSQGCGSAATGIAVGLTNAGHFNASMISNTILGFGVGYQNTNQFSVQIQWYAPEIWSGNTAMVLGPLTGFELNGGTIAGNQTAIKLASNGQIEMSIFGTQFFSNINATAGIIDATAVVGSPGAVDCHDCHFENQPSAGEHMVAGNVDLHFFGGLIVDDNPSAGTGDWFFSMSGSVLDIWGTEILCGRTTMTQAFLLNAPTRAVISAFFGNNRCTNVVGGANAVKSTVLTYSSSGVLATLPPWQIEPQINANGGIQVNGSMSPNGSGFKHLRTVSGCTTAAAAGATCDTVVTWTTTFPDSLMTPICTGLGVSSGIPLNGGTLSPLAVSATFRTVAATAVAAQYTKIACYAAHD